MFITISGSVIHRADLFWNRSVWVQVCLRAKNIFTKILQKFAFELENKSRREKKANRKELQSIARETRRLCFGLENIRRANYVKESVQIRARPKKRCVTKKSKIFFISRLTPNSGKWAREGSEKNSNFSPRTYGTGKNLCWGNILESAFFFWKISKALIMRQSAREWAKKKRKVFRYFAVCEEKSNVLHWRKTRRSKRELFHRARRINYRHRNLIKWISSRKINRVN